MAANIKRRCFFRYRHQRKAAFGDISFLTIKSEININVIALRLESSTGEQINTLRISRGGRCRIDLIKMLGFRVNHYFARIDQQLQLIMQIIGKSRMFVWSDVIRGNV